MRTLDILVVDDDFYSREVTVAVLAGEGHHVTLPDALTPTAHVDVVVIDAATSTEQVLALRSALATASRPVPVIMLTERKGRSADADARRLGADAALRAPFRRSELLRTLEAVVERVA